MCDKMLESSKFDVVVLTRDTIQQLNKSYINFQLLRTYNLVLK